jgi:hypothetical protein
VGDGAWPQEAVRKKERKQRKLENREKACLRNEAGKKKDSTHSTLSGFATSVDNCSLVLDARAWSQAWHVGKKRVYLPEASIRIRTRAWRKVDDLAPDSERTPVGCRAYIRM